MAGRVYFYYCSTASADVKDYYKCAVLTRMGEMIADGFFFFSFGGPEKKRIEYCAYL